MLRLKALSSVYGFVVIYLLAFAAIQTISLSTSSSQAATDAAFRAQEFIQRKQVEHLAVGYASGNLTVTNDGSIPSVASYFLLQGSTTSRLLVVGRSLQVGARLSQNVGAASSVLVVTGLGNVFASAPASAGSSSYFVMFWEPTTLPGPPWTSLISGTWAGPVFSGDSITQMPMPRAGTLNNLRVYVWQNFAGIGVTVTVKKNGGETALKVSIPPSTSGLFVDLNDAVPVQANDLVNYGLTGNPQQAMMMVLELA